MIQTFQVLPSIFIRSQNFVQKTLWGLEQQYLHHTVSKTSSFKRKLIGGEKKKKQKEEEEEGPDLN